MLVRPGAPILSEAVCMLWRTFWQEDNGQDLVEYALLAALIGVSGVLLWSAIAQLIGARYGDYNTNVQGASAVTPNP